ncbi:hypothetical protein NKG94_38805 [Micromonospora sp. M12]
MAGGLTGWFIGEATRAEIILVLQQIIEAEQAGAPPSADGA